MRKGKGPEVGKRLVCFKDRKEVCVARLGQHKVGDMHGSDDEGEEV